VVLRLGLRRPPGLADPDGSRYLASRFGPKTLVAFLTDTDPSHQPTTTESTEELLPADDDHPRGPRFALVGGGLSKLVERLLLGQDPKQRRSARPLGAEANIDGGGPEHDDHTQEIPPSTMTRIRAVFTSSA